MKTFLIVQIVFAFCSANVFAGPSIERPTAPSNSCYSYNQTSQYQAYTQCILTYNNQVANYQNQVNQYNQSIASSGGTPISGAVGLVLSPNAPSNTCGSPPAAADRASPAGDTSS